MRAKKNLRIPDSTLKVRYERCIRSIVTEGKIMTKSRATTGKKRVEKKEFSQMNKSISLMSGVRIPPPALAQNLHNERERKSGFLAENLNSVLTRVSGSPGDVQISV